MKRYFVTGTDTGVGKTTVSAGILAALRARGHAVAAVKAAETGCARAPDGSLVPDDGVLLRHACGDTAPLDVVSPQRWETPVAPHIAAKLEDRPFRIEAVVASLAALPPADLTFVEGAGGLLVPFSRDLLAADLAVQLRMPVLVVARASLGTINHTVLTVLEARRRGLTVTGVILNRVVADPGPDEATNAAEIERLVDVLVLGTVEHVPTELRRDPAMLAGAVTRAFDPVRLLQ